MGAWIETLNRLKVLPKTLVAPRVGAWIETARTDNNRGENLSHPVWVRGLKHGKEFALVRARVSHPVWVRGLKQTGVRQKTDRQKVAPCVGAWIETARLPLKSSRHLRRTPCGCVD